jgi:hypothetical protein
MAEHSELSYVTEHYQLSEADCNLQVTDVHVEKISSSYCEKWRSLPPYLKMEAIVAKDIDREHPGSDESEKRGSFFKKWKETRGLEATYRSLINALLETKCRGDAEGVCELLKKHTSMPPHRAESQQTELVVTPSSNHAKGNRFFRPEAVHASKIYMSALHMSV